MSKKTQKQVLMSMQELDKIGDWRHVVKGYIEADKIKGKADTALAEYQDTLFGKANEKGERTGDSLSKQVVALARKCKTEAKLKEAWDGMREAIKTGFTVDGERVAKTSVPQGLSDAISICRKAIRNKVLDKGDSTGTLKTLNKKAQDAKSAENPKSFADYSHLLREIYKAEAGEDDKTESPTQLAIIADLKGLVEKYTEAAKAATGGKTPTARKAAKTATK